MSPNLCVIRKLLQGFLPVAPRCLSKFSFCFNHLCVLLPELLYSAECRATVHRIRLCFIWGMSDMYYGPIAIIIIQMQSFLQIWWITPCPYTKFIHRDTSLIMGPWLDEHPTTVYTQWWKSLACRSQFRKLLAIQSCSWFSYKFFDIFLWKDIDDTYIQLEILQLAAWNGCPPLAGTSYIGGIYRLWRLSGRKVQCGICNDLPVVYQGGRGCSEFRLLAILVSQACQLQAVQLL